MSTVWLVTTLGWVLLLSAASFLSYRAGYGHGYTDGRGDAQANTRPDMKDAFERRLRGWRRV